MSMKLARKVIEGLFSEAGVAIDGPNPWDIQVQDERFYGRLVRDRSLGLGEAYMEGWWDCQQLDEFICRILKSGIEERVNNNLLERLALLAPRVFNLESKARSKRVAERHYDLGNDLFTSFLDPYNQYSCAYFEGTEDLNEAQQRKLELVCRKIDLQPDDRVLDIGCGWGGFSRYVAEHYNCSVTGVNISREQVRYAREHCKDLQVCVLECDYRELEGTFDKIVSIGMFEHVGWKNYRRCMDAVHRCLDDGGIFLLQTIGGNESRVKVDPWVTKYIFPVGMVPSIAQIGRAIEGLFVMEDWHNLGPHYEKTLLAWNQNFQQAWGLLRGTYDERFKRMWEYYLLSSAGAFRARDVQLWQIVLTKYRTTQPRCRGQQPPAGVSRPDRGWPRETGRT
jgi:cyclopropane-fatty-acyl-phospholipid synthase